MIFSIVLLLVFVYLAYRIAPREREEDAHVHGAGQIGLLAAVALFGVDYFTSFFYATGEMMSALHPYGLQKCGYIAAGRDRLCQLRLRRVCTCTRWVSSTKAAARTPPRCATWSPALSLIVAVVLIQDYVLTIVVSALSGGDQLLSILGCYGKYWWLALSASAQPWLRSPGT